MHEWRYEAACLGRDPELWIGEGDTVEALRVCRDCRVRRACLDFAVRSRDGGIWGGTTEKARRDVRTGVIDRAEAMARGDRHADMRTSVETIEEDEPWLLGESA